MRVHIIFIVAGITVGLVWGAFYVFDRPSLPESPRGLVAGAAIERAGGADFSGPCEEYPGQLGEVVCLFALANLSDQEMLITADTFTPDAEIVLIVRTQGESEGHELAIQMYRGDVRIDALDAVPLYSGDFGLLQPSRSGSYSVRVTVDGEYTHTLHFTIAE